ncbi:hypothetical protein ABT063_14415 [Streptomyces sp. NPDC002838]|uniref:hypothetical protein n=1 Tax=Streptomyces sp. NPDC002838 TaxID=3154436 RepID=UPI0033261F74
MTCRPSLPVRLFASALAAGALLTTTACSDDGGGGGSAASDVAASPTAEKSPAASPLAARQTPTPTATGRLTVAGARAALVTEADLEDDWTQVRDAAAWRDTLLIGRVDVADFLTAKADAADCQKLLDALFDDDLLGKPSGASALRGFQQEDSRLLHQVAAYDRAALDSRLAWLESLPAKCDQFTATNAAGEQRTVQVTETSVPQTGDARQGLHVTVQGTAAGTPATLTLDVAAVRVGSDALTVTAGGLDGDEDDSFERAVTRGTQRLTDVLAGRTPAANPGEFD